MALTGMAIYKLLPRTNCGDCKFPTCMAFAMQVAAKQKALTDCPHLSEQAKAELADASTPPMKLVHIGADDKNKVIIGQETVMFRHEKKFHNPPALAIKIPSSLSEKDAFARLEEINKAVF
ncbi:MAG: acetyl-CoA decarbonylase/synthase complex subunit gamma, partial [Kiritimatiellae bacterium]|nr:acetyl-CoA decarbonylase/synthase complex subunit gamma [Kiritimatiellia bacterium]